MAFAPGDRVHIANLGTGIVREVRNGRRYLVELKGRSVVADERNLSGIDAQKSSRKPAPASAAPAIDAKLARSGVPSSLDLHGLTVPEAVVSLDAFLNDAILAGLAEVRVIHGRGGGKLKSAVHGRLRELPSVRSFEVDPVNPGITIVGL